MAMLPRGRACECKQTPQRAAEFESRVSTLFEDGRPPRCVCTACVLAVTRNSSDSSRTVHLRWAGTRWLWANT